MQQELYNICGQTIFPAIEKDGSTRYASFPAGAVDELGLTDHSREIGRTKEEFEAAYPAKA